MKNPVSFGNWSDVKFNLGYTKISYKAKHYFLFLFLFMLSRGLKGERLKKKRQYLK